MKARHLLTATLVCLSTTLSALAAFTAPTEAQINAAAGTPSQLTALLNGASLEEAASVVKSVMVRLAGLGLSDAALQSRATLVISTATGALPASGHLAFCAMLGNQMGNSLAIRSNPALVSATQGALTTHTGTLGAVAAKAFGDAFEIASSGSNNAQNTKDADKVQPPSAKLYPGQN